MSCSAAAPALAAGCVLRGDRGGLGIDFGPGVEGCKIQPQIASESPPNIRSVRTVARRRHRSATIRKQGWLVIVGERLTQGRNTEMPLFCPQDSQTKFGNQYKVPAIFSQLCWIQAKRDRFQHAVVREANLHPIIWNFSKFGSKCNI